MFGYQERKAGQVAAFFGLKSGGHINVLKLAKLLYLAERESMKRFDAPMFYDRLVSMDHGPVTSISLNQINGLTSGVDWDCFVAGRQGNDVLVAANIGFADLDMLSKADLHVLNDLWDSFGDFHQYKLRDWTHDNCPEWENPHGSSEPIPHDRVYKFLQKPDANALGEAVLQYRRSAEILDRAL